MGKAIQEQVLQVTTLQELLATSCELRVLAAHTSFHPHERLEERAWEIALRLETLARKQPCARIVAASILLRVNTANTATTHDALALAAELLERAAFDGMCFKKEALEGLRQSAHAATGDERRMLHVAICAAAL